MKKRKSGAIVEAFRVIGNTSSKDFTKKRTSIVHKHIVRPQTQLEAPLKTGEGTLSTVEDEKLKPTTQ